MHQLNLKEGDSIKVTQSSQSVVLPVTLQKSLASGAIRISSGTPVSALLGDAFGSIAVERAE